jgi:hypothetical protein
MTHVCKNTQWVKLYIFCKMFTNNGHPNFNNFKLQQFCVPLLCCETSSMQFTNDCNLLANGHIHIFNARGFLGFFNVHS